MATGSAYSRLFGGCRALMAAAKSSSVTSTSSSTAAAAAKKSSSGNAKSGILKVVPVSPQLGKFLGTNQAARAEVVKKVWEYIKANDLQNPANKREIRCDDKLKTIFGGKDTVGFLEIAKLLSQHFPKSS